MESEIAIFFINTVQLCTTPFLCFYTVRDGFRMPVRKIVVYTLSYIALVQLLSLFIHHYLAFTVNAIVYMLCGALFFFRAVSYSKGKLAFILLLAGSYLFFTDRIGDMLNVLLGAADADALTYRYAAIFIAPLALSFYPFLRFMGWIWAKIRDLREISWSRLCLVPLSFIVLFVMVVSFHLSGLVIGWVQAVVSTMIIICAFVTYWQIVAGLSKADEAARLSERLHSIDNQLQLQAELFRETAVYEGEVRQIRHNMRHHFAILEAMLTDNETGRAMAYLQEYVGKVEETVAPPVCKNVVADAICRRYIALAGSMDIAADAAADIPAQIGIEDNDLSVLLGNLWENAFEACVRQSVGERYIQFRAKVTGNSLMISMANSYDGVVRLREGSDGKTTLLSRKRDGEKEGIGIASIQAITRRYRGLSEITYESGRFNVRVLLYTDPLS